MNKKTIAGISAVVAVIIITGFLSGDRDRVDNSAFHVTLASPDMYKKGIYSEKIVLDAENYTFRFVPNGDSPTTLSISLQGKTFDFSEDFELVGTLHQTGISEYYTWDYSGQKTVTVPTRQQVLVEINPNGNVMGAVSVYILKE